VILTLSKKEKIKRFSSLCPFLLKIKRSRGKKSNSATWTISCQCTFKDVSFFAFLGVSKSKAQEEKKKTIKGVNPTKNPSFKNAKTSTSKNNISAKSRTDKEGISAGKARGKAKTQPSKPGKRKAEKDVMRWRLARHPYSKKKPGPGDKGAEKKRPFGPKKPVHKSTPKPGQKVTPKPGQKGTPKPGHKSTLQPAQKSTPRSPPGQKKPKPVKKAKPGKIYQSNKKPLLSVKKKQTPAAGGNGWKKAHKTSTNKKKPGYTNNKGATLGKYKKKGDKGKKPSATPVFFKKTAGGVTIKNQIKDKGHKRPKTIENEPDSLEKRPLSYSVGRKNSKKYKDEREHASENEEFFGTARREARIEIDKRAGKHSEHGRRRVSKKLYRYCPARWVLIKVVSIDISSF